MTSDPAPRLLNPDDAFDRLAEWRRQYDLLMSQRDPLVKAGLSGPLSGHGGVRQAERASRLTAQTLRRIKDRDDIPLLAADHFDDVDWDEYADYLETLGTTIRRQLAALPAPADGRAFTADDLRADLLVHLAQRLRDTELTDAAHWQLTVQLRHEAQADTPVPQEEWSESTDELPLRAARARILGEVADQITAFRTEGPTAAARLDADVLARARAQLAPPSNSRHAQQGGRHGHLAPAGGPRPTAAEES
ncbi:hypothetical protein [Streptomyces noursei]|uniref:hypothetical protein n=1 Tax=Streptomyces noursei TaxID=1971 RepID=UPI001678F1BE|nr:hypothetical protein [Streptomyces noursei]MCZ1021368.1 hypothetical protein [Streptomyces noursei]GGX54459.1 hypothetical protein GCM10010341_89470 [Streptomyces noursei]